MSSIEQRVRANARAQVATRLSASFSIVEEYCASWEERKVVEAIFARAMECESARAEYDAVRQFVRLVDTAPPLRRLWWWLFGGPSP